MAKTRKTRASQQQQQNDAVPTQDPQQQQDEPMDQNPPTEEQPPEEEHQNDDVEEEEEEEEEEEDDEEEDDDEEEEENQNDVVEGTENDKSETINNGAEDDDEPVEKLLEPFSKQQLVLLMKEAVAKHPDLIPSVENIADADPAHRKIFVHGLGWDTTTDTLISEYSKYGEIEDCKAVVDKVSGKSKGYGFILFKHRVGARRALKQPQKKIGNRVTNCQLASAGPVPAGGAGPAAAVQGGEKVSEYTQRKIFVSNVAAEIDPGKLTEFFSRFGEIEEGPLGLDKQTGKPKGFALFVYKNVESAKKALEEPKKVFEGHTLNVVKAVDGPKPGKAFGQGQFGGGHGHHVSKKAKFGHGHGHGQGHLMAPAGPPGGFNPGVVPPPALTPVLGQALSALLNQGGGLGLGNLFGGLGNPQGMPPSGYQGGGYQQGGYGNPQGGNRSQQGGGSYMGR